jgi:tetratricopeptide (TPR) repeat protein
LNLAKESKDIFDDASRAPAARDIFAGDDKLYKLLDDPEPLKVTAQQSPSCGHSSATNKPIVPTFNSPVGGTVSDSRLSIVKIVIRVLIGLIACLLLIPISLYCISAILAPQHQHTQTSASPQVRPVAGPTLMPTAQSNTAAPPDEPVSWKLAQAYYQKKDYERASAAYERLSRNLSLSDHSQEMWDDYLKLKLALCAYHLKEAAAAQTYFAKALQSSSPAIVAITNYHLAFIKNEQKNYVDARTRAYKAISLLETIDPKYSDVLIADCYFLIAEALTAQALSGSNQTLESPAGWPNGFFNEPLEQLNEAGLQTILHSGITALNSAAIGPQIQKAETRGTIPRWFAKCLGASMEELFAKFVAMGNQDIRWSCSRDKLREEPVTLYLTSVSMQKFFEIVSGSAGLLASIENGQTVIHDPRTVASVAEHRSLLTAEAISSWQRFMLSYHNESRIADAHFALGLLQQSDNHLPTAIGEFEQVANRFMRSPLAAYALLNAAKIKVAMQDNTGARDYLRDLCAQYPDSPVANSAAILLAQTSMTIGDYEYAQRVFRKVYNLDPSADCKLAAALGAAKSYFALKNFTEASEWFIRYIMLAKQSSNNTDDLRTAYVMLAAVNIELGKFDDACRLYQSALTITSAPDDYFDIATKLVGMYLRQQNFVEALDTVENIDLSQLSDGQVCRIWLTKAQIFYAMNLTEQAAALLAGKINSVQDAQLRSEMAIQLARCHIALSDLDAARDTICQAMLRSEPGMATTLLQCELADICVKLGDNAQAIKICSQILASSVPDDLQKRTQNILGTAYTKQKQYNQAAKIFSGL